MSGTRVIRFDDAWARAIAFVESHPALCRPGTVLVRDLQGQIRLALDDREPTAAIPGEDERAALALELDRELGAFSPGAGSLFLLASRMFAPDELFGAPEILWAEPASRRFRILDRTVTGADWLGTPLPDADNEHMRITLFGIKGGVGRSTATAVLAWRLSQMGKRVLVVDLDLESPGVGTTILAPDGTPEYGIVDWFVEELAGQADESLLREMIAHSPLGDGGAGILVVPAGGRERAGYEYLPKLARVYTDSTREQDGLGTFGDRLHELVSRVEGMTRPDVVLLDSRSGIHDIAAAAITRMNATCLLFAMDTPQTWYSYRVLFQSWRQHFDRAAAFRDKLKMVAAQVPETGTRDYLQRFTERAHELFADNLYLETPAGEPSEFNFDIRDPDAPHSPVRIHWSRSFQQFDPVGQPGALTDEQIRAAFGDFVRWVALDTFGEEPA